MRMFQQQTTTISAVVRHPDGQVENLGVIYRSTQKPLARFLRRLRKFLNMKVTP